MAFSLAGILAIGTAGCFGEKPDPTTLQGCKTRYDPQIKVANKDLGGKKKASKTGGGERYVDATVRDVKPNMVESSFIKNTNKLSQNKSKSYISDIEEISYSRKEKLDLQTKLYTCIENSADATESDKNRARKLQSYVLEDYMYDLLAIGLIKKLKLGESEVLELKEAKDIGNKYLSTREITKGDGFVTSADRKTNWKIDYLNRSVN